MEFPNFQAQKTRGIFHELPGTAWFLLSTLISCFNMASSKEEKCLGDTCSVGLSPSFSHLKGLLELFPTLLSEHMPPSLPFPSPKYSFFGTLDTLSEISKETKTPISRMKYKKETR